MIARRLDQHRRCSAVPCDVVAAEAGDAARVHQALHEVVALHAVLVRGAVGKVRERRLAELVLFELPEVLQLARPGESRPASRSTGPRSGCCSGWPCEWHWMQVSFARTKSSFAGLTMLAAVGAATCSLPGPWHRSQPTFHSVTVFVWTS